MKDFNELTEDEILALTQDDIERYIDLAAAENGVALLPPAPVAPTPIDATFDVLAYEVGTFTFTNKGDALDVRDVVNKTKSRVRVTYAGGEYSYSGPKKVMADVESEEVTECRYLSENNAAQRAGAIADAEAAKTGYVKARADYDKIVLWRQRSREPIMRAVRDAQHTRDRRTFLLAEYDRYLTLADQNRRVAARFLQAAHSDANALLPQVFVFDATVDAPLPRKYHDDETPIKSAAVVPEEETVL